jgi:hypothetical protein
VQTGRRSVQSGESRVQSLARPAADGLKAERRSACQTSCFALHELRELYYVSSRDRGEYVLYSSCGEYCYAPTCN